MAGKDVEGKLKLMTDLLFDLLRSGVIRLLPDIQRQVDIVYSNCVIAPAGRDHNRFFHELCPLVTIAGYVGDEDTRIVLSPHGARFDGCIIFSDGRKQNVELTAAVDGYNDHLVVRCRQMIPSGSVV